MGARSRQAWLRDGRCGDLRWGAGKRKLGLPGLTGPAGPRHTRGCRWRGCVCVWGGRFARAPRCPCRLGLSEAGELQACVSRFLLFPPPRVPGRRRAKVGAGIGPERGTLGASRPLPGLCFPVLGRERAELPSCLPGDAPRLVRALALRLGWVPVASPWVLRSGRSLPLAGKPHGVSLTEFQCHAREVYLFLQQLRGDLRGNG